MEKEYISLIMVINLKANMKMMKDKEKAKCFIKMVKLKKVLGKMIN